MTIVYEIDLAPTFERFAAAMQAMVDQAIARLIPPGREVVEVRWGFGSGLTTLEVELDSGEVIRGQGSAKLEAILNAQLRRLVVGLG